MGVSSDALKDCCFFGRPREPLAFYLPPFSDVSQQRQSPLYGVLPKELRDLIWEYTLADDNIPSPASDNVFRRQSVTYTEHIKTRPGVACALLQTCKAIYLETYRLPFLLNGFFSYNTDGPKCPDLELLLPWQYALIQRVDLSLQQVEVECGQLDLELSNWHPRLKGSGAYVAPRFYNINIPSSHHRTQGIFPVHNFGLIRAPNTIDRNPEDGDKVTLPHVSYKHDHDDEISLCYLESRNSFTARAMVARPLTHLTIRISRTDWWTWTDDPATTAADQQLALDPALGKETRPLLPEMLALATQRRKGQHPEYNGTWGAVIATLPDLKTLELILETFSVKKRQLDTVIECAKTWKFPLKDTKYELAYDGAVEGSNWSNAPNADNAWETDSEQGSADMDIDDGDSYSYHEEMKSVHNNEPQMSESVGEQGSINIGPASIESSLSYQGNWSPLHYDYPPPYGNDDLGDELEHYTGHSPPASPTYSTIHLPSPTFHPTSPVFEMPEVSWVPWLSTANEFEVRVVRFRRGRKDGARG